MKVSVITPCLNGEKTIEETVKSVLGQTYENIEYIIVDGGSTDQTIEVLDKYCSVSKGRLKYISEKDDGIYDAMNKGILQASGDVIGIINSDDWYEIDAVEKIVKCFCDTNADAVYGEIWVIDENGQREYHTVHSAFPPHPSTFIKRCIYQKYGMFDTSYRIAADRDLLLRFMKRGIQFKYISQILANFRKTGISNTRSLLCAKETYEINMKYLGKYPGYLLNKVNIEESYDRAKLLYLSKRRPQAIREAFSKKCRLSDGVIIFGAGNCGMELELILAECDVPVSYFVDNDEAKWGLERHGIKIYSPEILRYCSGHVVVTVTRYQKDICSQLDSFANPLLTYSVLEEIRKSVISNFDGWVAEAER